jgi:hypothetical protein
MFSERSDNSEGLEPVPPGPTVLSLDIDGTLVEGDPPGPIGMDLVARAIELGYVVGSASDRTIAEQRKIWERQGFAVRFVTHKHHLHEVAAQFPDHRLIHIGDTDVDAHYAHLAGFEFHFATRLPEPGTTGWIF